MDVLSNKSKKEYKHISRYASFNTYYNTLDNKFIYGLTNQLDTNVNYIIHKLKKHETLDMLSNYYYGRPDFFWVIADFNHITDCFINVSDFFSELKIPSIADIQYKRN